MRVAIASGKGGTGKTTVAVNLAWLYDGPVRLLDCDVEEPNAHLFLKGELTRREVAELPVPVVDPSRCDGCGACGRLCQYHAIVSFGTTPLLFAELCHSCGGCALVCPRQAIREEGRRIGEIEYRLAGSVTLVTGRLDVGVAMAPPLIRAVKSRPDSDGLTLLDAPPGTSCPVIATLKDADGVVLVTEPTPFGLHDLTLAVDMVRELGLPFGVVINRSGAGDDRVHQYCQRENVPILAEIPDDRRIAETYSRGELIVESQPEHRQTFLNLWLRIRELIQTRS